MENEFDYKAFKVTVRAEQDKSGNWIATAWAWVPAYMSATNMSDHAAGPTKEGALSGARSLIDSLWQALKTYQAQSETE